MWRKGGEGWRETGIFSSVSVTRSRHLTSHTHFEKPPLPPQLQLMQMHLNVSIFATQHFKKK